MIVESVDVIVGITQRSVPLHEKTLKSLDGLPCNTIVIDSTPVRPIVNSTNKISVLHQPNDTNYFSIALLIPLFKEFLKSDVGKLFLIEGDMVLSLDNIVHASNCIKNTKAYYVESNPESQNAYVRCEGMAGVLLRKEVKRIYKWMIKEPIDNFTKYPGYNDCFLWYAVSNESSEIIPVLHMTHDDKTRLTKQQRYDMKMFRQRKAEMINYGLKCNQWKMLEEGDE